MLAGARDLRKEGTATTAKESEYNKQAAAIQKSMDSIMVATFGNAEDKELARKLGMDKNHSENWSSVVAFIKGWAKGYQEGVEL